MDTLSPFAVRKISCTDPTGSEYKCTAIQYCCASKCCNKEWIDTALTWYGVIVLMATLIISLVCWCRRRQVARKDHQRAINMLSAGQQNKDFVVDMRLEGEKCGVHTTKSSFLPANISLVVPEFPLPNSKLGKTKTGQYDTEPLLSCESSPASLESTCPLN